MSMREKFTAAEVKIHYMEVKFDAASLAWADFRGTVHTPAREAGCRGVGARACARTPVLGPTALAP